MDTREKMQKMMEVVEREMPDDGRLCIHMLLNDGHHDEWSARHKISKMVPVAYIGAKTTPRDMHEYLDMLGVTPSKATELVEAGYEKARRMGKELNISAPDINANQWDCYWCVAMMIADYWATHWGDLEVAGLLAYQYLSDPDKD